MPGFCLSDEADSALRRVSALAIEINLSRYARKFLSWRIVDDKVNITRWLWDMGLWDLGLLEGIFESDIRS